MIRIYSLKGLLLAHNLAFLLLIVVTGAMGWLGVVLRQEAGEEAIRLNTLMTQVQEARGDVYRQMTEAFNHHFLAAPHAVTEYLGIGQRLQRTFLRMDETARSGDERAAIEELKNSYLQVRSRTDEIMATPSLAFRQNEQLAVFFTADLQMSWVSDYERVFNAADGLLEIAQTSEQMRVATLNRNTGIVLAIPIVLAAALLLVSRVFLQRAFVHPIGQVLRGLTAFARGNLDHKVPEVGSAELVTLERAVNQMAADLAASRAAQMSAERQAAHGALVPVVAHNIRNPLASIRAAAQVLEGAGVNNEAIQGLRDIRATVDRLERWLTALLSYLNPLKLARTEARLTAVADHAIALLQPRLEAKGLRVRRKGWEFDANCLVDVHLMEQAIYGLLANAVEASPDGEWLQLTLRSSDTSLQLVIADRGAGMPFRPMPDDLNPGPTTKSYGSGLGIPFAFKICELHEGVLEFGARDGGGTEVIITLPTNATARTAA